jgi:predicted phage-related endonuclease
MIRPGVVVRHIRDRAEWLAWRQQDLTPGDIAAVAGFSRFRSPYRVYAEKAGLLAPAESNALMERGRWGEPMVLEALRETHPTWTIKRAGVYLSDPSIRMGATPDFLAIDPEREGVGNIQAKFLARPSFEREWLDGETLRPPLHYQLQTLGEAHLLDSAWASPSV